MCKVTSAGPDLIGGVAVVEAIGICIEFCATAEAGSIKPPPAKALASKNCRRDKRLAWCSFIVRRSSRGQVYKATVLSLGRSEVSTTNKTFLTEREDERLSITNRDSESAYWT
jgi:hypothetical protein